MNHHRGNEINTPLSIWACGFDAEFDLERRSFDWRGLAGSRLPNDVDVRKPVFVFDAEQASIVAKIDTANVYDVTSIHPSIVSAFGYAWEGWNFFSLLGTRLSARLLIGV